jgi:hypothetical protein
VRKDCSSQTSTSPRRLGCLQHVAGLSGDGLKLAYESARGCSVISAIGGATGWSPT